MKTPPTPAKVLLLVTKSMWLFLFSCLLLMQIQPMFAQTTPFPTSDFFNSEGISNLQYPGYTRYTYVSTILLPDSAKADKKEFLGFEFNSAITNAVEDKYDIFCTVKTIAEYKYDFYDPDFDTRVTEIKPITLYTAFRASKILDYVERNVSYSYLNDPRMIAVPSLKQKGGYLTDELPFSSSPADNITRVKKWYILMNDIDNRNSLSKLQGSDDGNAMRNMRKRVIVEMYIRDGFNITFNLHVPGMTPIPSNQFTADMPHSIDVLRGNTIVRQIALTPDVTTNYQLELVEGEQLVFKSLTPSPFQLKGLPHVYIARSAGESKYYCNPSIVPGDIIPFLPFDSQVHGVKVRALPTDSPTRYAEFKQPSNTSDTYVTNELYEFKWIAQRIQRFDAPAFIPNVLTVFNNNIPFENFKDSKNFNNALFPNGDKSLMKQRNNQREGDNMALLSDLIDKKQEVTYTGMASAFIFGKPIKLLSAIDDDELFVLNIKNTSFHELTIPVISKYRSARVFQQKAGWWKNIDTSVEKLFATDFKTSDPINIMALTFRENYLRYLTGVENKLEENFRGNIYINSAIYRAKLYKSHYEILDRSQFTHSSMYLENMTFFNNKRPVIENRITTNVVPEKGLIQWQVGSSLYNFTVNVTPAKGLSGGDGFYNKILGDQFPARNEKGVEYRVSIENSEASKFTLQYTYENELGFLSTIEKPLVPATSKITDNIYLANFDIQGGGYHEISLLYRAVPENEAIIVAGKELSVIELRFVAAVGSKEAADFHATDANYFINNATESLGNIVNLKEGRGEGNRWYLNDYDPAQNVISSAENGYRNTDVCRTYVIGPNDKLVFSVMDADPHTFMHYKTDFYMSERALAKRLTDFELISRIKWYVTTKPVTTDGKNGTVSITDLSSGYIIQAYGRYCNFAASENLLGYHYLSAVYNNTSVVCHKIVIRSADYNGDLGIDSERGVISRHKISAEQRIWLNEYADMINLHGGIEVEDDDFLVKVDDIYSQFTYVDGPRAKFDSDEGLTEPGSTNRRESRFGPQNDFNASFFWELTSHSDVEILSVFEAADRTYGVDTMPAKNLPWFPNRWIRHYSDKEFPSDIRPYSTYISTNVADYDIGRRDDLAEGIYEPWQKRLPWISSTMTHGLKTRWNIKCLTFSDKLFNDKDGVFTGKKFGLTDETAFRAAVYGTPLASGGTDGTSILPGFDLAVRRRYDFFLDLHYGRLAWIRNYNLSKPFDLTVSVVDINNFIGDETPTIYIARSTISASPSNNRNKLADNNDSNKALSATPNPSKTGLFTLNFYLEKQGEVKVNLYNITGQLVYNENFVFNNAGNQQVQIGNNKLPTGIYILKVLKDGIEEELKLIVE